MQSPQRVQRDWFIWNVMRVIVYGSVRRVQGSMLLKERLIFLFQKIELIITISFVNALLSET